MAVKESKTPLVVNVEKELKVKLQRLAEIEGRSLSNYVTRILLQHLEEVEKKH